MKLTFEQNKYCGSKQEWQYTRKKIHERSQNKCEFCGVDNYSVGKRNEKGVFIPIVSKQSSAPVKYATYKEALFDAKCWNEIVVSDAEEEGVKPPKKPPYFVIVLTVAHLDHDATNNDLQNLKHLCQKCHLQHDATQHVKNARETLKQKKQLTNTLF